MVGLAFLLAAIYLYFGRRRYLSVFFLFLLITAGFQIIPLSLIIFPGFGISKPYDWAYVYVGAVFLFRPDIYLNSPVWRRFRVLVAYAGVLIILFIYSYFFEDIELPVSIRVLRNFFTFIVLFLFIKLSIEEQKEIFRLIIYATCLASVIYCVQPFLNMSLLNLVSSENQAPGEGIISRYYNVPVLVFPVIFFLFFPKEAFEIKYRSWLLGILVLAILLTQHRNMLMAVGACYLTYVTILGKIKLKNALLYASLGIVLFIVADLALNKRFSEGLDQISELSAEKEKPKFSEVTLSELSTSEFRKLLFQERLAFILKSTRRSILGIGLMTDDSNKAGPLEFYVGIPDDDGNISQISNIDIAWASMLLQFGLLGTLAFIWLHFVFLRKFFALKKDPHMLVGILYIVSLFITSFYGSLIAMPYVSCLLMLFASYNYQLIIRPKSHESGY